MTPQEHDLLEYAAWRQDAAFSGSLTIRGGPDHGKPYELNVTLKAISDKLDALAVGAGMDPVAFKLAVQAAIHDEIPAIVGGVDPAVRDALVDFGEGGAEKVREGA